MLGVTLVLADGTIVNAGGKVVKNVAGYDLGKLVCGSRGRLAFIGRVSLRLHPDPVTAATVVVQTDDPAAVAARLLASQLVPSALDVLHPGRVAVLFEGGAAAVAAQVAATRSLVGGEETDGAVWDESRSLQGAALGRTSFAPGDLRAFLDRTASAVVRPAAGIAYLPYAVADGDDGARQAPPGAGARALRPARDPRMTTAPDVLRSLTSDCVHCGFCLPTCPTYLLWSEEMDSPRGRIQLMESHLDGTISLNPTVVGHFDLCLGCMACVTACPSGVQYDKLIEATRETIETETRRPFGDRFVRGALFKLLPYPRRMGPALRLAPLGRKLPLPGRLGAMTEIAPPWRSTEKPEGVTPAGGETRGRVGILTGCVQSVVFGSVNAATARVLAADGYEVVAPPQGCCGALSMHAGRGEEGRAFARKVIEAFEGVETVIVNTSGCGSHLKELGHVLGDDPAWAERAAEFSTRVRDLGEFLEGVTPRAPRHPLNLTVAMQDSCHLRHAQRLPLSSAVSLRRIPGLTVVEPAEQDICCGSAGIYNITQADAARQLGDRKAGHVLATGAQVYASANPGCLVQVATALRRAGSPLPALHPIEIVDASIRNIGAAGLLRQARR